MAWDSLYINNHKVPIQSLETSVYSIVYLVRFPLPVDSSSNVSSSIFRLSLPVDSSSIVSPLPVVSSSIVSSGRLFQY